MKHQVFENFVKNRFMYLQLFMKFSSKIFWKFWEWNSYKVNIKFWNILGKLWGIFSKNIRKFREKLTKFWVLLSKYLKNSLVYQKKCKEFTERNFKKLRDSWGENLRKNSGKLWIKFWQILKKIYGCFWVKFHFFVQIKMTKY